MVKLKTSALLLVLLIAICVSLTISSAPVVHAAITYQVNQEWLKVWIYSDASVNFLYNISFTYLSGSPQGYFDLGMPNANFQIRYVQDLAGNSLQYSDISSGGYTGIEVTVNKPIILNQPNFLIVYGSISGMIFQDSTNPGNVGMQFYPATFQETTGNESLKVEYVLPEGVPQDSVRSPQGLLFDNIFTEENRTAVYWERSSWSPGSPFYAGVSFPQQYVPNPTATSNGGFSTDSAAIVGVIFAVVAIAAAVAAIKAAKSTYVSPSISVEALGANRSLTAVEAGLVLGLKPVRVITMMLYGLLFKQLVIVAESEPIVKLKKLEKPASETASDGTSTATASPRYYEIDFLNAIKADGTLDEAILAEAYRGLVNTVNQKLKGYSRQDTENYYRSIVEKAWSQVTQAGTAQLMGEEFDKNLEWLLADHNFDDHLQTAFPPGIIIIPSPAWWWYWGGPRYPSGQTSQTGTTVGNTFPTGASMSSPTTPAPKPIAGQDFANNIVRGVQGASNNIVKDVQNFANNLVPFGSTTPKDDSSSNKPSCACACHACACHCACVSCACACAGGGAR